LNPTDWKHRDGLLPVDATLGCDFAGVVDAVGADVTNVKVGDRVASFVHGGRYVGVGSFAQYIQTEGSLVWKVPDNITFEQAAALGGVGPHTAFQALYLRLAIPHPSTPATSPQSIFIYGGSTSVGLYAIQLAKLSGLHVITCCSPRNHDLVKSLGADEVVDYNDASAPAKLKAKHPTLALGFDCIAEKGEPSYPWAFFFFFFPLH
jgi:NADPH:quinone reductase-like Zn-dependent oxidoreductase